MDLNLEFARAITRRHFFRSCQVGLGSMALASLMRHPLLATQGSDQLANPLAPKLPPHAAKAKSVIYLHMAGSPTQLETFDAKPELQKYDGKDCPEHLLKGKRFAFIEGVPRMLATPYKFKQHGQAGTWVSELLPHFSTIVDDVAVIRSMHTEQFNHAPAQLLLHTGSPRLGHASMGSWVTYGLGSENQDLPGFVVLVSGGKTPSGGKSLWGSGFLPSVYQGVQCRTQGDPVLYLSDPEGMNREWRRKTLDALRDLNQFQAREFGDPETLARISQYELAYRMQIAVPEVMDISKEPPHIHEMYGTEPGKVSFANNCLLARRLVESGVRFVQLYEWGWDHHGVSENTDIHNDLPNKCREVDRPMTALVKDLKQRGKLDDTIVIWGGEFGRTPMRENRRGKYGKWVGRDHHNECFTIWMAGGGIQGGVNYGETDEIGYYIVKDKMTPNDLQATVLHLLGFDAHRFSYPFQGLNQRLIGPSDEPKVQEKLLA